jgi:hypothetical protein
MRAFFQSPERLAAMTLLKKRSLSVLFTAAAVALFFQTAPAGADDLLRYKFSAGQSMDYEMTQKMSMTMNVGDMVVQNTVDQIMTMTWVVESIDEKGLAQMKQTIKRVRMKMAAPGGVGFEFDSADDEPLEGPVGPMLEPMLRALAKSEFTFKMDGLGKISDAKIPAAFAEQLKAAGPAGAMFSKENLTQMTEQSGVMFPVEPVAKDGKWKSSRKVPPVSTDMTYVLQGITPKEGRQVAEIKMTGEMEFTAPVAPGATVDIVNQEMTGQTLFDTEAGVMLETNVNQHMEMEVEAMGQTIQQTIDQTVSNRLLPKKSDESTP